MPAIKLAELRKRTNKLSQLSENPNRLVNEIKLILSEYGNKTFHGIYNPNTVFPLKSFFVSPHVLNEIIKTLLLNKPDKQFINNLSNRLWSENYIETKIIAIELQNNSLCKETEKTLRIIEQWITQTIDRRLTQSYIKIGTTLLVCKANSTGETFLWNWLTDNHKNKVIVALSLVTELIQRDRFENIPQLFNSIRPLLEKHDSQLIKPLENLFLQLLEKHKNETMHFIKLNLATETSVYVKRIVMQLIKKVDLETKNALRNLMRNHNQAKKNSTLS